MVRWMSAAILRQQRGRDIAARVERHGGETAVGMSKLLVRAALADLFETVSLKQSDYLPRLENRQGAQGQATWTVRTSTNSDSRAG